MSGPPTIELCMFHRCTEHEHIGQLNGFEEATGSECGACVAMEMLSRKAQWLLTLDALADRLTYSSMLKRKLTSARERLNMLSPGAGDFLDEFEEGEADE